MTTPSASHRPIDTGAAILAHLSAIIAMFLSAGSLSFLGPLVIWLLYRDRDEFTRKAAADSFNFNLAVWVGTIVSGVLAAIAFITLIGIPIALALGLVYLGLLVVQVVCHVLAAMRASSGEIYTYPFSLRVLR